MENILLIAVLYAGVVKECSTISWTTDERGEDWMYVDARNQGFLFSIWVLYASIYSMTNIDVYIRQN